MGHNRREWEKKHKSAKQRSLERELLDKRYHARKVIGNKGRSREWRYMEDDDTLDTDRS